MKKITFEISDDAFDFLLLLKEKGFAEYRDSEFDTLEDFKNSSPFKNGLRNEEWFLSRNFNGTFYRTHEPYELGLIELNDMSWYLTFKLSELGKKVLENFDTK